AAILLPAERADACLDVDERQRGRLGGGRPGAEQAFGGLTRVDRVLPHVRRQVAAHEPTQYAPHRGTADGRLAPSRLTEEESPRRPRLVGRETREEVRDLCRQLAATPRARQALAEVGQLPERGHAATNGTATTAVKPGDGHATGGCGRCNRENWRIDVRL